MSNYTAKVIKEFRERFYLDEEDSTKSAEVLMNFTVGDIEQFISEKLKEQEAMYEEAIDQTLLDETLPMDGSSSAEAEFWVMDMSEKIRQAVKEAKGEV